MCWKQSWAMSISSIEHAIKHIERAKEKLVKRKERNEKALKKTHDPNKVRALIQKNSTGIEQCEKLIADLRETQDELYKMIHEYGFSRSDDPKRVYKLMGKYRSENRQDIKK